LGNQSQLIAEFSTLGRLWATWRPWQPENKVFEEPEAGGGSWTLINMPTTWLFNGNFQMAGASIMQQAHD
jgi:hypothetical protein